MLLYCPFAIWRAGPRAKLWPDRNIVAGVIEHSAEGPEAGMWSQLDGLAEASWHFSIMRDGRVYQHYALNESPWHGGSRIVNSRQIGVEHEGVAGEVLAGAQLDASVKLTRWIAEQGGWTPIREVPVGSSARTLWEHHELNPATTCPNGRIPWAAYLPQPVPVEGDASMQTITLVGNAAIQALLAIDQHNTEILGRQRGAGIEEVTLPAPPAGFVDIKIRVSADMIQGR